jgi:hypothetical protein
MRRLALPLALALLVVCVMTAAALAARGTHAVGAAKADQVRAAVTSLLRAGMDGDAAAARKLLAPDFQLIDPFGAPESRKTYLETLGGGVDFVTLAPVSPIRVRVYGNIAVARFQEHFVVVAGPDRLDHRGWITDLFERRNGRWLLVWSQTTATPNDPDLLVKALKAHS